MSGHDRRRWTVGVAVSSDARRVVGAAIAAHGAGFDARATVELTASILVPRATRRLFQDMAWRRAPHPPALAAVLASELADALAACVHRLAALDPELPRKTLCLAAADPGLWRREPGGERACLGLSDGARLAERTGINVLDAFAARDLAQGGQGEPLLAAPYWLLTRSAAHARAILWLDRTTSITLLPASRDATALERIAAATLPVGPRSVVEFAKRGSANPLAAPDDRGSNSDEPLRELDAFLQTSVQQRPPLDRRRAALDWLATAIAARMNLLATGDPAGRAIGELLIAGPASKSDFLKSRLLARLPGLRPLESVDVDFPLTALEAAATAWWGQLWLDQTPGNLPLLTGANAPRVLGRLTPGAPHNFLRLVRTMASQQPVISLGAAI